MTALKVTDEMRRALASRPAGPIPVEDGQTRSQYVLLSKDDYLRLHDDYTRRELQVAFNQVDRGEIANLDMNVVLTEAYRRHASGYAVERHNEH